MKYQPKIEMILGKEIIDGKLWWVCQQKDNGIGWHWDDMPVHVREEYIRTRNNIELLGGRFYYENVPGEGATATIKVPSDSLSNNPEESKRIFIENLMKGVEKKINEL